MDELVKRIATHAEADSDDERSRSVSRLLAVLEQLSVSARPLSNHELAESLGVPSSSMYRLLQKLVELGYAEFHAADSAYAIGARLGELGVRLANAGGRSPPLKKIVAALSKASGHAVSVWVPNGVQVRIAVLSTGKIRSPSPHAPGDIASAFSTPGLAIASQYSSAEVREVVAQCRRRRYPLGRRFRTLADIDKAVAEVRRRGYALGYNLLADGWGVLAWPIPLSLAPRRIGALAIGAAAATLRSEEARLVGLVERLLAGYVVEQEAAASAAEGANPFA